ncbi:hypothetical protein BY458DRAFT_588605 [Sporodiniella umbellata]|nr:hypothetical protein BY458DRAFT_588605 [Sporodiniella umbellata]
MTEETVFGLEKQPIKTLEQVIKEKTVFEPLSDLALDTEDLEGLKSQVRRLYQSGLEQAKRLEQILSELTLEKAQVKALEQDNQSLKQATVKINAMAEQEEEYIANRLLKRITTLKQEKDTLLAQVEVEEEYMTNKLQKKLRQLQREKIDMENALEQEQAWIVRRLQKQLQEKSSPALLKQPMEDTTLLLSEVAVLKAKSVEMEKELRVKTQKQKTIVSEIETLRQRVKEGQLLDESQNPLCSSHPLFLDR